LSRFLLDLGDGVVFQDDPVSPVPPDDVDEFFDDLDDAYLDFIPVEAGGRA
jgi:hypothetical protein